MFGKRKRMCQPSAPDRHHHDKGHSSSSQSSIQNVQTEEGDNFDAIELNLNNLRAVFTGERWKSDLDDDQSEPEVLRLREDYKKMTEETRMARLANEILIDMVTSKCLKIQQLEREIERLEALVRRRQPRRPENS